jgi:hypothetical protein
MRLQGPWTQEGGIELGQTIGGSRSPDEWFADWYANGRISGPMRGQGGSWTTGYAESPRSSRQFDRFLRRVQYAQRRYKRDQALRAEALRGMTG